MAKRYKKKMYLENDYRDSESCNDIRKNLNSSERWRGKREAVSGVEEYEEMQNQDLLKNLRWNLEHELADQCYMKEKFGPEAKLSTVLQKLGIGKFNLHRCTCELPERLSDEEILKRNGYL